MNRIQNLWKTAFAFAFIATLMALNSSGALAQFGQGDQVRFRNAKGEISAQVGATTTQTFTAYSNNQSISIRYKLIALGKWGDSTNSIPANMTIDSVSGLLTWTPADEYYGSVGVEAYDAADESNNDIAMVDVWAHDFAKYKPCALVKGYVKDSVTNQAIKDAEVRVVPMDDMGQYPQDFSAITDNNGYYSIPVSKGNFQIEVFSKNYFGSFYPQDSANPYITISCNDTIQHDFALNQYEDIYLRNLPDYKTISMGDNYSFTPDVEYNGSYTLTYSLSQAPSNATIDAQTGVVSWTANQVGAVTFIMSIQSSSPSHTTNQYAWNVYVVSGNTTPCATISGYVKDQNGNALSNVYVNATNPWIDSYNGRKHDWDSTQYYDFSTWTDSTGHYSLTVLDGQYYLVASNEYDSQMWGDSTNGGLVTVNCNDNISANFILHVPVKPTTYVISGHITSASDGSLLNGGVEFYPQDDSLLCFGYFYQWEAQTNDSGYYEIELPAGNYKAYAYAYDWSYYPEFYNDKQDYSAADIITLNSFSQINFALSQATVYNNGFNGIVIDSTTAPISAFLNIFSFDSTNYDRGYEANMSSITDSLGTFSFTNIPPGDYYLFAIPTKGRFAPGFYKADDFATFDWSQATKITVPESGMLPNQIVVKLASMQGWKGHGIVKGIVKGKGHGKGGNGGGSTDALQGVTIVAYDKYNRLTGSSITDANGQFSIEGISNGEYTLKASKIGYDNASATLTVSQEGTYSVDLSLSSKVTGVNDDNSIVSSLSVVPNPASEMINLKLGYGSGLAEIKIMNLNGEVVLTKTADLSNASISFDASSLSNGTYFAVISQGGASQRISFQVSK